MALHMSPTPKNEDQPKICAPKRTVLLMVCLRVMEPYVGYARMQVSEFTTLWTVTSWRLIATIQGVCVCLKRFLVRRECKSESLQLHGQLHDFGQFLITAYGHYWREVKALNGNILFCTTTIYILSLPLHLHETIVITFE